jgi:hypothetical protein
MALRNVGILTYHYMAHNPEDHDLNLYPSSTHFTLKMEAAWSTELWYSTTSLHGA